MQIPKIAYSGSDPLPRIPKSPEILIGLNATVGDSLGEGTDCNGLMFILLVS
jgi:hypothetical protein